MSRACTICQHLKRSEIDRRLAAGEPGAPLAHDYGVSPSSLHRHRQNCLKLGSSNAIKKEAARGSAATALLPTKETLSAGYFELGDRIDEIVKQATQQGSLSVAISGLNSIRHTLDSLTRLAGHDRAPGTQINVAVQTNLQVELSQIVERLILAFDHEPELKARIAQALLAIDQPSVSAAPATSTSTSPSTAEQHSQRRCNLSAAPSGSACNAEPNAQNEQPSITTHVVAAADDGPPVGKRGAAVAGLAATSAGENLSRPGGRS